MLVLPAGVIGSFLARLGSEQVENHLVPVEPIRGPAIDLNSFHSVFDLFIPHIWATTVMQTMKAFAPFQGIVAVATSLPSEHFNAGGAAVITKHRLAFGIAELWLRECQEANFST